MRIAKTWELFVDCARFGFFFAGHNWLMGIKLWLCKLGILVSSFIQSGLLASSSKVDYFTTKRGCKREHSRSMDPSSSCDIAANATHGYPMRDRKQTRN